MEGRWTTLIVEDDPRWQERYTKTLNQAGFKVVSALTIGEAKVQLNQQRFDLAIVDMNLTEGTPQSEGLEILEEIRKRDDRTAIVVSTGYPTVELAVEGFEKYHIDRFHEKRKWAPDAFRALIEEVMREQPDFKPEQVLTKQFDPEKLGDYWHTYTIGLRALLEQVGQDVEPFVPETLTPAMVLETPAGEIIQIFGWSRGFGAPVVLRLGKLADIKQESASYNKHQSLLAELKRPLRKVRPPYYRVELGALLLELVGAPFGEMRSLSALFRSGQHDRFLSGLSDLLDVTCQDIYQSKKSFERRIDVAPTYAKHVEELVQRRETRLRREQDKLDPFLAQLNERERTSEIDHMRRAGEEKSESRIALGFPTHHGELADPIAMLAEFRQTVSTVQTLISQQLSAHNAYVDRDHNAWLIYSGWLYEDSPAIELTGLETELKFSLLPPAPVTTYITLEKRLDSADSSLSILDGDTRTIFEAVRLVRAFARRWQPDERFYRFLLALQAARIAETPRIPEDRREGALFSATWHASQLLA